MFDPKKYVNDNVNDSVEENKENSGVESFIEKRIEIIDYLNSVKPFILKECESMESTLRKNPNHPAKPHFEEKSKGWSHILVGLDIVTRKYKNRK
jgi:hypothetical protein